MFTSWTKRTIICTVALWAAVAPSTAQAQTVVVTLKSYDSLIEQANYIASLVGGDAEERFKQVRGLIQAMTDSDDLNKVGLDTKRPLGLYLVDVPQPGQHPKGAVIIPISNEDAFCDLLKGKFNVELEKGSEKGRYKATAFGQTAHLRFANGYLYISDSDANLSGSLPNPSSFLPAANKNNLLAGTIRLDQVPKEAKQQVLKELDKQIEKDNKKKSNETDAQYQFRMAATKMARETVTMLADDAKDASLTFNIDKSTNLATWDLALTPKPDSKLAGRIRNFTAAQGVSPIHFEISLGKLAMLLMSEKDEDKTLRAARQVFLAASKDNSANIKLSLQGGDALHLRLDLSTHLIKLGAAFAPLGDRH